MSDEQNFNDAELQDIMNEIENLEKEFNEEQDTDTAEAVAAPEESDAPSGEPVAEEESADEESAEEESSEEEDESLVAEAEDYEEEQVTNVVPITEKVAPVTQATSEGHMEFSGQGSMDLQLNFQLGSETAKVTVAGGALKVTMAGVELNLSEAGCEVEMAGGVKFSVPLTEKGAQGKKAA